MKKRLTRMINIAVRADNLEANGFKQDRFHSDDTEWRWRAGQWVPSLECQHNGAKGKALGACLPKSMMQDTCAKILPGKRHNDNGEQRN